MNEQRVKVAIGTFVLLGLVVLAVLIMLFGGMPTLFSDHERFTVMMPSAPGVGPGTPVRRSGVPIGSVESLELDETTGQVRIVILVKKKYTLPENVKAVLNQNLLGDTTIDIEPRTPAAQPESLREGGAIVPVALAVVDGPEAENAEPQLFAQAGKAPPAPPGPLKPGSVIPGEVPPGPQTLLNQATELLPTTQRALIELGKAAESFNRVSPTLEGTLREFNELARSTRELVPEVRRTNDEIQVTVRNWGTLAERLNVLLQTNEDKIVQTLNDLDDVLRRMSAALGDENLRNFSAILKNTKTASERLPSVVQNTDEFFREARGTLVKLNEELQATDVVLRSLQKAAAPLADYSDSLTRNLDEASEKLNKAMTDIQDMLQVINRRDGTLQRLIADPSLYNNLNELVCQFGKMTPRLEQVLKDIQVFTDKIARHPESLGVGGAIRPGSGIK